jgi:Flp pilus assembly protein TadD
VGIVADPMPATFTELVGRLAEAMGQRLDAVRTGPEGIVMRTSDGFVFAFLEDPSQVSLAQIQRLLEEVGTVPARLVVLTPGRLPLALGGEVLRAGATLVESTRFHELVRGLSLGEYLGDEPRPSPPAGPGRLLPSARLLDTVMQRGRTWLDWGVPALALRFFRQASTLKPEFAPARTGIGQALLGLGLAPDARRAFEEALTIQPGALDAQLGLAAVQGAEGHVDKEIDAYVALLTEDPGQIAVRAHLIAALISQGHWGRARDEIARMLQEQPEDPQMRFLHSVALAKTGAARESTLERDRARALGLAPARERALCAHLGLPAPEIPVERTESPPRSESAHVPPPIPARSVAPPPKAVRRFPREARSTGSAARKKPLPKRRAAVRKGK